MARKGKEGWVKISRKLIDDDLWTGEPFTKGQAWVDLILLAQWENNGPFKPGSVYRSLNFLADRWGWSRKKVSNYLEQLKKSEKIDFFPGQSFGQKKAPVKAPVKEPAEEPVDGTRISLKNWRKYQYQTTREAPVEEPVKAPVEEHNIRIYKEKKKGNADSALSADAVPNGWKTDDPRVPVEYRCDFGSYEDYYNWRNQ